MPDPYVELENETPIQRRDRLMNLLNPAWTPLPNDLAPMPELQPEPVVAPEVAQESEPDVVRRPVGRPRKVEQ